MQKLGGAGLAIVVLTLGGCGSATTRTGTARILRETVGTTPTHVIKAQFIAKADGICRDAAEKKARLKVSFDAVEGEIVAQQTKAGVLLRRKAVVIARDESAKFAALLRPPGGSATIEKIITAYSEEEKDATNAADALAEGNSGRVTAADGAMTKEQSHLSGLAQGYGFEVCGRHE
jgi:hypothetical protein